MVAETILSGAENRMYDLLAWVVMPNHVHMLMLPKIDLRAIMQWLKGTTARQANMLLGRTGKPFWQAESYDRYARNSKERDRLADYIENNPVSAGLVTAPALWRWSSAGQAEA
jgi:REP element-mobilizing transposase RayT